MEAPGKIKVLIIDDEYSLLRLVQMLLTRKGYDAAGALSSPEARNLLMKNGPVDLIILDLMMPNESGFAFLEWLDKQSPDIKNIPVIVNTAKNLSEDEKKNLECRSRRIVLKEMNFTENLTFQIDELFKTRTSEKKADS